MFSKIPADCLRLNGVLLELNSNRWVVSREGSPASRAYLIATFKSLIISRCQCNKNVLTLIITMRSVGYAQLNTVSWLNMYCICWLIIGTIYSLLTFVERFLTIVVIIYCYVCVGRWSISLQIGWQGNAISRSRLMVQWRHGSVILCRHGPATRWWWPNTGWLGQPRVTRWLNSVPPANARNSWPAMQLRNMVQRWKPVNVSR